MIWWGSCVCSDGFSASVYHRFLACELQAPAGAYSGQYGTCMSGQWTLFQWGQKWALNRWKRACFSVNVYMKAQYILPFITPVRAHFPPPLEKGPWCVCASSSSSCPRSDSVPWTTSQVERRLLQLWPFSLPFIGTYMHGWCVLMRDSVILVVHNY